MFSLEAEAGNDLGAPEMPDDAVENVAEEKHKESNLLQLPGECTYDQYQDEGPKTGLGSPVHLFESWVANGAYHQNGNQ